MSKKRKSIESKNTTPILIFVSVVAFGIVVALAQFTSHLEEFSDRNPASIQKQQFKKLHEKLSVHQKIKPPISISIEKELIGKIYAGDEFEITAKISTSVDTHDVKVVWNLPEYLEVLSGELMHTFSQLESGEVKTVRLTLKSYSEDNQQIHVTASAPYGKQILSAVDQFNTTAEEEINEAKANLVKRNLEYIGK